GVPEADVLAGRGVIIRTDFEPAAKKKRRVGGSREGANAVAARVVRSGKKRRVKGDLEDIDGRSGADRKLVGDLVGNVADDLRNGHVGENGPQDSGAQRSGRRENRVGRIAWVVDTAAGDDHRCRADRQPRQLFRPIDDRGAWYQRETTVAAGLRSAA